MFMNKWRSFFVKTLPYCLIFLFTLLLFRSFFSNSYFMGHDSLYHITSTEAIVNTLKVGNFSLDILPEVAYNFGYGSGMFYSQIFHLCAAFFALVTDDLILAFKITHILIYFLTGCAFYVLSKNLLGSFTKNPTDESIQTPDKKQFFSEVIPSIIGALLYLSAPYHLADHLIRDAETEVMVFLFIPLILNSFFHLLKNCERRFLLLFTIGYTGLFFSNSALALFFTFFLGITLIVNYKLTTKKSFLFPFLKGTLIVVLLIAPYYLNIIQQRAAADYVVFSDQTTSNNYYYLSTSVTPLDQLLIPNPSDDYLTIPLTINLVFIIGMIIAILKLRSYRTPIITFFISAALTLSVCSLLFILPIFPWDSLPSLLTLLQFAWRLEAILLVALTILTAFTLSTIKSSVIRYTFLTVCTISCFYYPTLIRHDYFLDYSAAAYPSAYYGLGWGHEYLPEKANLTTTSEISNSSTPSEEMALATHSTVPIVTAGLATISDVNSNTPDLAFSVSNLSSPVTIELPRLYYLGYKITTAAGESIPYEESPNGFIQIRLTAPTSITVKFTNTNLVKLSRIFAFGALIYLSYFSLLRNRVRKNQD